MEKIIRVIAFFLCTAFVAGISVSCSNPVCECDVCEDTETGMENGETSDFVDFDSSIEISKCYRGGGRRGGGGGSTHCSPSF